MSTLNLRNFSQVSTLRAVDYPSLVALLQAHDEDGYLAGRGVAVGADEDEFDFDALRAVLVKPTIGFPDELADALYIISEMATTEGMDKALDAIEDKGLTIDVGDEPSAADVAVKVWLQDQDLLESLHAERFLHRPQSFEYYCNPGEGPVVPPDTSEAMLAPLRSTLDDFFDKRKRGRHTRVLPYHRHDGVWFLVRHGQPMDRRGVIGPDGETEPSFVRPEKYDVVVFDPILNELRVNAGSVGEKRQYREQWGLHFFGSKDYFSEDGKYTLDPLGKGLDAVVCSDFPTIEEVRLVEVHIWRGGTYKEMEIRKATDYLRALDEREWSLEDKKLRLAKFQVKFTNVASPRSLTVRPPNIARYTRNEDSIVLDTWLQRRGFARGPSTDDDG